MADYMKTIKNEYQTLQKEIEQLNEQMKEKSKILMREAFKDFFEKYDEVVESIFWHQYTPYFNDGETCEFNVYDVHVILKDDDDPCDYEGSEIFDEETIKDCEKKIADFKEWKKDPMAAARAYQINYVKKYYRDPFENAPYSFERQKTPEEKMAEWTPHYGTQEEYEKRLEIAKKMVSEHPELKSDFREIKHIVSDIDKDMMKAMFGDHAKVVVTKDGIEVEKYDHD